MISLHAGSAHALIDEELGARICAMVVDGVDVIVSPLTETALEPLMWGCYPMAPFAGRVRDGAFTFADARVHVPRRDGTHALHGTVDLAPWTVVTATATEVELSIDLGPPWPFRGTLRHRIRLAPNGIWLSLDLEALEAMPAQVGWHPWFARPISIRAAFPAWFPRGPEGMPAVDPVFEVPVLDGVLDDCFLADDAPVRLETPTMNLELSSDCSHWVVYTGASHGVCVEPQSGPPNEFNTAPRLLEPGEHLRRWFEIRWEQVT